MQIMTLENQPFSFLSTLDRQKDKNQPAEWLFLRQRIILRMVDM